MKYVVKLNNPLMGTENTPFSDVAVITPPPRTLN